MQEETGKVAVETLAVAMDTEGSTLAFRALTVLVADLAVVVVRHLEIR